MPTEREAIEANIRAAFAGVGLGSGVSLRQAAAIDVYFKGYTPEEYAALPQHETTDNWTQIPEEELATDNIAHLDPEGRRYYLPALMLWLLDHYDLHDERRMDADADMTIIGTMMALAPPKEWRDRLALDYAIFSEQQRAVIARFLEALPRLVDLGQEDAASVKRSMAAYWSRFLASRLTAEQTPS